jgi:hypothetical protein
MRDRCCLSCSRATVPYRHERDAGNVGEPAVWRCSIRVRLSGASRGSTTGHKLLSLRRRAVESHFPHAAD